MSLTVRFPQNLSEHDPTGRAANEPGAKLDAGKPRCALVLGGFSRALEQVALVGTFGAAKYTDHGWRSVPNGQERYTDALWRHLLAEAQGLELDPDSSLLHAAHTAWNALARLELILQEQEGQP
jgi:hypothetical protein